MKLIARYFRLFPHLFVAAGILFIPFSFILFPVQAKITALLFGKLSTFVAAIFFGNSIAYNDISSDSGAMYALLFILATLALLLSILLGKLKEERQDKLIRIIRLTGFYYLALILLKYGFDKLCKGQFYLPEPNILFTPLGKLDKDILFWSSMGTSYLYNIFIGMFEVLAGALLLFRRTRNLALILSLAALVHVLCINIGFDISVKLYSTFLIVLTLVLLYPIVKPLIGFLLLNKQEQLDEEEALFRSPAYIYVGLKVFVTGILLLECLYPHLQSGSFNDDTATRPYLHGAYAVTEAYRNDTLIPLYASPAKRFFIHRRNYIIFQKQDDSMQDFNIQTDSLHNTLYLTDYDLKTYPVPFTYNASDSTLIIRYTHNAKYYTLKGKGINWRLLPAVQDQLHWSVEQE